MVALAQEVDSNLASTLEGGFGVVWVDQEVPLYLTADVTVPLAQAALGPAPPRAVQALVEVQETPFR
jgi:hypothetical protein